MNDLAKPAPKGKAPDISIGCSIEPYQIPKPIRRGIDDIVRRIARQSALQGDGRDLLLRVYMAGVYHGVELSKR